MVGEASVLAVIPARGGSTRIKKKNIAPLGGKPLIAWTIEAAKASGLFFDILVSTDDPEIAATAAQYGASVPFLRDSYADANSPVSLAVAAALDQYEQAVTKRATDIVMLMPTCPFRTDKDILDAYGHFVAAKAPAQISCTEQTGGNCWWACTLDGQGRPTPLFPETLQSRSQDLPALYFPSGAIWIARKEVLLRERTFYAGKHIFCPLSWRSAFDIDTPEDMALAEALLGCAGPEPAAGTGVRP